MQIYSCETLVKINCVTLNLSTEKSQDNLTTSNKNMRKIIKKTSRKIRVSWKKLLYSNWDPFQSQYTIENYSKCQIKS